MISVTAFIDWQTQMHNARVLGLESPTERARRTLDWMARAIAQLLCRHVDQENFQVLMRLYHGWNKGFEPTENRRAIKTILADTDFSALSRSSRVVFLETVEFGDNLVNALPSRFHPGLAVHLPNTLREKGKEAGQYEKMVDTAMASDILSWAVSSPDEWALIVAEDDDFVPPLYTAEAMIMPFGGRVFLARKERKVGPFLKLDGLLLELRS